MSGRHKNNEDLIIRGWGIANIRLQCYALFPGHTLNSQYSWMWYFTLRWSLFNISLAVMFKNIKNK